MESISAANRRMSRIGGHLIPLQNSDSGFIKLCNTSSSSMTSPVHWRTVCSESGKDLTDIIYQKAVGEGIAKITINRPERRNAFRPLTVRELMWAFDDARQDLSIGVIILTGNGTKAFCSGGDQIARGEDGPLLLLDLQLQIRRLPKPVIAMVAGYAIGGGNVLHMVGSFDAGYGSSIMSRLIGPKKAREMWYLTRFYPASEAEKMGLINTVVPLEKLEEETVKWSREILRNSPTAIRVLKSAINAVDDGFAGLQELGGNTGLVYYGTEEGDEGNKAFREKRAPDFSKFPRLP